MNRYESLRKQNTTQLAAVAVLVLCVLLSSCMLCSRLLGFSPADQRHYIPLDKSRGSTSVTQIRKEQNDAANDNSAAAPAGDYISLAASPVPAMPVALRAKPGFRVKDDTIWKGRTDIEIFRISYKNGSGQVTVNSTSGEKLLAPGTTNTYEFALENTGNTTLHYTMDMEAYFSHGDYPIPVNVTVTDYRGNYLAGSEDAMADVLTLNRVAQAGDLSAGHILPYTLTWEWPFEEDDTYDTMLGNMAVNEDITLTIVINTMATYTDEPGSGIPATGDTSQLALMVVLMLGSLAGMLVLLLCWKGKREEQDA